MVNTKKNIARAHHYVPQFYLAGFTSSGSKKATLYVHDLLQLKTWTSTPAGAGHKNDFYRINHPDIAPDEIERFLGGIEAQAAKVIRQIVTTNKLPEGEEFQILLHFIGLMAIRVPSVRDAHAHFEKESAQKILQLVANLPDEELKGQIAALNAALNDEAIKNGEEPLGELTPDDLRQFVQSKEYEIDVTQNGYMDWFINGLLATLPTLVNALAARYWVLQVVDDSAENFICTDHPVTISYLVPMPAFMEESPGFGMPETVVNMPLSRKHALVGILSDKVPDFPSTTIPVSREMTTITNTILAKRAYRFIFSSKPDFIWQKSKGIFCSKDSFFSLLKESRNHS